MPLLKNKSKAAFVHNIKAELAAGKPRDQALAIAYSVQRASKADGGALESPYAMPMQEKPKFTWRDTWPVRLAKDAWEAVQLPGKVYRGEVSMYDENGRTNPYVIEKSFDLAGLGASGGLPMAERGAAGAFGGKLGSKTLAPSETANAKALLPTEQAAYHGTRHGPFEKFEVRTMEDLADAFGEPSIDRALGIHVAKDQAVARTFADSPEGIFHLGIPHDNKFLEVPEYNKFSASVPSDEAAISELISNHIKNKYPELHDNLMNNSDDLAWQEAIDLFRNDMQEKGYVGLKYQNAVPEEVPHHADPTSYIIFDPSSHIRNLKTGKFMSKTGNEAFTAAKANEGDKEMKYASGGAIPFGVRESAKQFGKAGLIASPTPGRADSVSGALKAGSYVMPADVVSAMGQGNTMAGARALNGLMGMSPFNANAARAPKGRGMTAKKMRKFADGGATQEEVPVNLSGGEFIFPPEAVAAFGDGDMQHGHEVLDAMVKEIRRKNLAHISQLPPPRKD